LTPATCAFDKIAFKAEGFKIIPKFVINIVL
jgi:hypothetical protein